MTRRKTVVALVVLATILTLLAIFAVWVNRQLLNTDNWTETSSALLADDEIRGQVADFLVAGVYANVDVQAELQQAFGEVVRPQVAGALAAPAASGLQNLAEQRLDKLLGRPRLQQAWENANRRAHELLVKIVEGGGDVVSTSGGVVTLDLKSLLDEVNQSLGIGGRVADRLPESAAQITILRSSELEAAQTGVEILRALPIVLVALALGLFALAVFLARDWRRRALRACGFGLLFAGAAALVVRSLAGDEVVNALVTTESVEPAAQQAWSIGTSLLVEVATASLIYGVFVLVGCWFAGETGWAVALRRNLAPYLREAAIAWSVFGLLVLLLVWWAPTPAFRRPVLALILIALLAFGFEMLRRQVKRESPDAKREDSFPGLRRRISGLGGAVKRPQ
jgi:hypothetical protein